MTADWLRDELARLGSFAAVARAHNIPVTTLKGRANRLGVSSPQSPIATAIHPNGASDEFTVSLPAHPKRESNRTPEQALRDHGLDPAEFAMTSLTDNYWRGNDGEGPAVLTQSKITVKPRTPSGMVIPPRTDAPLRKVPRAARATSTKPLLVALPADQHCPHQDPGLEACWLEWVRHNQPGRIVGLGDIGNKAKPSRHRPNLHEQFNDTANQSNHEANAWWRRTLEAAPKAEADQIPGNHDLREQIACMERLPDAYDITRPGEEHPWYDLEYLIGLDKLGITYHRPRGEYHSVEVFLTENFSVTHGAKAGPHGGAPKDAAKREHSSATGHAHKASITVTVRYRNGEAIQHVHVSVPTMARRDLGYTDLPDTHQGFATLTIHADGTWNAELALYDDRRKQLWWRDQTYCA